MALPPVPFTQESISTKLPTHFLLFGIKYGSPVEVIGILVMLELPISMMAFQNTGELSVLNSKR